MKRSDEALIVQAHRMLLSSSVLEFTKKMFAYVKKTPYIIGEHHLKICGALDNVINGKIKKLIINIGPRYGKCQDPNTQILTSNGIVLAKNLRGGEMLYSYDNGKLVLNKCIAVGKAHKPSVRIKMRSGREFVCSYDHPMLTPFGYKEAATLVPGDRIEALCSVIDNGGKEIDDNELTFATLMMFDGSCHSSLSFTKGDASVVELMRQTCLSLGLELKAMKRDKYSYRVTAHRTNKAKLLLEKYGLLGHLAYTKRIPKDWFGLSLRQRLMFIDLMFATDGYAQGNGTCGIALANKGLIEDIQYMLSTIGIISSFYYKPNKCHGAWVLCIPRRETKKLLGMITFHQKRKMAERALQKKAVCITDTYPYEIISKEHLTYKTMFAPYRCSGSKDITREKFERLAEHFDCLKKYISNDFYLDKVVSVESVGDMELVDIEVEGTHNFIGNGLVSHNTQLVSQMFIAYGFALNPRAKFLHLSYSGGLTTENSMAVRDIVSSEYFQKLYEARLRFGSNRKDKWSTEQGGGMYATSTLGQITGFGAGQVERDTGDGDTYNLDDIDEFTARFNPDQFSGAIVIDDPIKPEDALSDSMRENVNRRFETTIRNRVNSRNTPIIVIMQRLHEHDLCGYLQEVEPDQWTVLSLPAITYDENGNEKALWPFKHTLEELHHLKAVNPIVFATQYMQDPKPFEGLLYREFDTYVELPNDGQGKECCYVDTADKGSDFLCAIFYTERPEGNYIRDVILTQDPMDVTEPRMAHGLEKNETEYCTIESNNGGGIYMRNVKRIYVSEGYSKCSFFGITQTENKEVRLFSKANEVNNVTYMPKGWERLWPQFSNHIKSFRKAGKNAHDDPEDALTGTYEMRGAYGKDEGALCTREAIRGVFEDIPDKAEGVHIGSAVVADNLHNRFVASAWVGNICTIIADEEDATHDEKKAAMQNLMRSNGITSQRLVIDEGNPDYLPIVNGAKVFDRTQKPYNPEFDSIRTECGFRLAEMINHGHLKIRCTREQRERITDDLSVLKQAGVQGDVKRYSLIRREQMSQLLGRTPDYLDMLLQSMIYRLRSGGNYTSVRVQTHTN